MPSDPNAVSTSRIVHGRLDISQLPWARPLQTAYEHDFESVAAFFAGNPRRREDWAGTIRRVRDARSDRSAIAAVTGAQLAARGAPAAARSSAAQLADPSTVAVLTGQQAGLFGGPAYTLFKAVTTIQVARRVAAEHGVPAVAVFWIASEDHDWAEVRSTSVIDADGTVRTVAAPDVAGAGLRPVGALAFDDRIAGTLQSLGAALPRTVWTDGLLTDLARCYQPGSNLAAALARWLDELVGGHGLIVFDGADPAAKPLASSLFARELAAPERTARAVRSQGDALRTIGHNAQVVPAEHATALFYLDDTGRHPIRFVDGAFRVGRATRQPDDLAREAVSHPERFSPNVMLRPLVQDVLFPTICYVGGPGELAYHAQLGGVYAAFGIERPLLVARASATMLDPPTLRFLERYGLAFERLAVQDDSALNALAAQVLAPGVAPAVAAAGASIDEQMTSLKAIAVGVDPTLAGAADTTMARMHQVLDALHAKIVRAAKRRDETVRRQFLHARTVSFPNGQPQERVLGVAAMLNQYGPRLVDQLIDGLPPDADAHYLLAP